MPLIVAKQINLKETAKFPMWIWSESNNSILLTAYCF